MQEQLAFYINYLLHACLPESL